MEEKRSCYAAKYVDTASGTFLTIAGIIRALVAIYSLLWSVSIPTSDSFILSLVKSSVVGTVAIYTVLEVLIALGLTLVRFKHCGASLIHLAVVIYMIASILMIISSLLSIGMMSESKTGNHQYNQAGLIFMLNAFYYNQCRVVTNAVRDELKSDTYARDKGNRDLPIFCLAMIVATVIDIFTSATGSMSALNIIRYAISITMYYSLYLCMKDFNKHHSDNQPPEPVDHAGIVG